MGLVQRATAIVLRPKEEWEVVAQETPDPAAIITGYVLPLALIPAIGTFLGSSLLSVVGLNGTLFGVVVAVISYVATVGSILIAAAVVMALAPSFASVKDYGRAVQLMAYSATPSMLAGILGIIPFLSWLSWIIGLYGLVLMYHGMPIVLETPRDKVVVFMIVAIVVMIVASWMLGGLLSVILLPLFGLGLFL